MKRPDDLIESLEANAKRGVATTFGNHYPLDLATPRNILELIRYVKVLEKALDGARGHTGTAVDSWIRDAERELEAQP